MVWSVTENACNIELTLFPFLNLLKFVLIDVEIIVHSSWIPALPTFSFIARNLMLTIKAQILRQVPTLLAYLHGLKIWDSNISQ